MKNRLESDHGWGGVLERLGKNLGFILYVVRSIKNFGQRCIMPKNGQDGFLMFQNKSILSWPPLSPQLLPRNKLRRGDLFVGIATWNDQTALLRCVNLEEWKEAGLDCQLAVLLLTYVLYMLQTQQFGVIIIALCNPVF